jgi:hypothetical protein
VLADGFALNRGSSCRCARKRAILRSLGGHWLRGGIARLRVSVGERRVAACLRLTGELLVSTYESQIHVV